MKLQTQEKLVLFLSQRVYLYHITASVYTRKLFMMLFAMLQMYLNTMKKENEHDYLSFSHSFFILLKCQVLIS
jgi:hypothetical protein